MPASTRSIPREDGDPWVFNLERPKLRSLGLITLEVTAVVLICLLGFSSSKAFAADGSPGKLCLCQTLGCAIGLTVRKYGSSIPWLRMGILHYLPLCLLLALVHQAADNPMLMMSLKLLLVDGFAFTSATLVMYRSALSKWDQMPHPTWEGFPIFWREGPEHAAAAFSEWLKHLRWELEWQWGKAMDVTEHRYGDAAQLHSFEGSAAAATKDDFGSLPTPRTNPHLNSIPEEPLDGVHMHPGAEPSLTATPPAAPTHTPKGAGATLPEALHEQATENAVKDEVPSTTDEDNGDTPRPTPSTPAAPSLENKEVATNIDVQKKMPSAIQNHAPSTPLTLPPAATVQEEPATAASLVGSDSFTTWMNCSKDADLDTMLFGRLRIPIMAQAGAVPVAFVNFSSSPILAPADKETAAAASGAAASGDEDAFADGLATLESMGPASHADGNATAAEKPVHGSSAHLHPQTTPTCQGSMSEGPTTPPATPRMTPMASLRRSASSLKEKMIVVKASFRSKRGADVTLTQDRGDFRPHTGCFTGLHSSSSSSSRRGVKAAAATIKRKLTPNRTNRGVWKV